MILDTSWLYLLVVSIVRYYRTVPLTLIYVSCETGNVSFEPKLVSDPLIIRFN